MILSIAIGIFVTLEVLNVLILYFKPTFKYGNGIVSFKTIDFDQETPEMLTLKYMTYWVAGTKVIFIALLMVILFFGEETIKLAAAIVMIPSIGTYYYKLHPLMIKLDKMNQIRPQGYSKQLGITILVFIVMFGLAVTAHLIMN